eukprot:CAMPEP_0194272126 /NCGR_PEP_ID=MMETSP0169-20130528/5769_1 /TAXON_ID=218684 /ORGANISM="Corethron pennatum, Strain L29A3" /LENGTH=264 /DNA_ID=CAMNT_0039014711 /DNA_START=242 /DNA_END=1036 /DNA_ORIENTATION=-
MSSTNPSGATTVDRYLLQRHGQTDANAAGIIQGSSDFSRLTPTGRAQAAELSRSPVWNTLSDDDGPLRIDRVFVSPLARARETLDILLDGFGEAARAGTAPSCPGRGDAVALRSLREIDLYGWEDRSKTDLRTDEPVAFDAWKRGDADAMVLSHRGGADGSVRRHRPLWELWERASSCWVALAVDEVGTEKRTTLVSCHGSLGMALLGTAAGVRNPRDFFRKFEFPNCGVVEVEWVRGEEVAKRWRVLYPDCVVGSWDVWQEIE